MLLLILILLWRVNSSCHCVVSLLLLLWRFVEALRADRFALASRRVVAAVAAAGFGRRCGRACRSMRRGGSVIGTGMLALLAARFRMLLLLLLL